MIPVFLSDLRKRFLNKILCLIRRVCPVVCGFLRSRVLSWHGVLLRGRRNSYHLASAVPCLQDQCSCTDGRNRGKDMRTRGFRVVIDLGVVALPITSSAASAAHQLSLHARSCTTCALRIGIDVVRLQLLSCLPLLPGIVGSV